MRGSHHAVPFDDRALAMVGAFARMCFGAAMVASVACSSSEAPDEPAAPDDPPEAPLPPCDGFGFEAGAIYPTGNHPQSLAAADFNGDGVVDLLVASSGTNEVNVLRGMGDGTRLRRPRPWWISPSRACRRSAGSSSRRG